MTTTDPVKTTPTPKAPRKAAKRPAEPERFALLGVWAVLFLVFSLIVPETFPTSANISNMLGSQAVLLVLALGLIVPLRAGDYDLSVASTLNLSAVVVAVLNVNHGWNIWAAVVAAITAAQMFQPWLTFSTATTTADRLSVEATDRS